ncbi:hypothetical protein LTR66_000316 [Elasticomyces elasticus]|nr:hypothetical protein LTR66_000316 [Elasticomyces elasticus]
MISAAHGMGTRTQVALATSSATSTPILGTRTRGGLHFTLMEAKSWNMSKSLQIPTSFAKVKGGHEGDISSRQYTFCEKEKAAFENDPESHLEFRRKIEAEINLLFPLYTRGTDTQNAIHKVMLEEMLRRTGPGHEKLKARLIPQWLPGCRRFTPVDGYLETLNPDNVQCVFREIKRIVPNGVMNGPNELHQVDILVCATAHRYAEDVWREEPNLYLGITAPSYSNYFFCIGPGGTWSKGTILLAVSLHP